MFGVRGQVQREGGSGPARLDNLTDLLASVGNRAMWLASTRWAGLMSSNTVLGPDPRDPTARLGPEILPGRPRQGIQITPRDF
jgi:error-prone DNA polymerase